MFEAVCFFLDDLADPTRATALTSRPGYFATTDNGLAVNNGVECRVTVCAPNDRNYVEFVQIGGACPVTRGTKYLTNTNMLDVYSFSLNPDPVPGLFDRIDGRETVILAGVSGVRLSPEPLPAVATGLSASAVSLAPLSADTPTGRGFLLGGTGEPMPGQSLLVRAMEALAAAALDLSELQGFVLQGEALVALVGDKGYVADLTLGASGAAPRAATEVPLPPPQPSGPALRRLAQATCLAGAIDPAFQRLTVDIYRLETSLERLDDDCS